MIYAIIALIIAGVVVAALSVIGARAIRENSRLKLKLLETIAGEKALTPLVSKLKQELLDAQARDADLSEALEATRQLYNKILQERNELAARNTALVEAMEARPTQPKRAAPKRGTARIDISEGERL